LGSTVGDGAIGVFHGLAAENARPALGVGVGVGVGVGSGVGSGVGVGVGVGVGSGETGGGSGAADFLCLPVVWASKF
jgi:hypothetical protein